MVPPLIFVSYSHKDEQEKELLLSHLGVLQQAGAINAWSDNRIRAGEDWEAQIDDAMAEAKVAVLLISANFLTSDFIQRREVPTLLTRHKHEGLSVFPVIARHCAWREIPWLAEMNVRPKNGAPVWGARDGDVDEKLTTIAEEIYSVVKAGEGTAAAAASTNKDALSAIRIGLDGWAYLAGLRRDQSPDRILLGQHLTKEDEPFHSLENFLKTSIESGFTVEVSSRRTQGWEKIASARECWTILLSLLVLDLEDDKGVKWLVKKSVSTLKEQRVNEDSMIHLLWEHLCRRYCDERSPQYLPDFLNAVLAATLENAGRSNESLYLFITFLYGRLESDTPSIKRIVARLQRFDEELGNAAAPAFLKRVKILIGKGTDIATHGIDDIPPFDPKLVAVTESRLCDYEFEAMLYPLTVKDYSSLRGDLPKKLGQNPSFPYVFKIVSEEGHNLYNLFASEVMAVVERCRDREREKEYDWDVPTMCEWLALAGCEDQPFPWGDEAPTPPRASLDYGSLSKLQPVGAHPLGASRWGAHDCCGNVHEVVRISTGNMAPRDFRLAGGCYQTNARFASCQVFRPFRKKREDNRRNAGVRLIRYRKQDEGKRFSALQAFLSQTGLEPR